MCVFSNVCVQYVLLFLRKSHIKSRNHKYYNTEVINKYNKIFHNKYYNTEVIIKYNKIFHFKSTLRSDIYVYGILFNIYSCHLNTKKKLLLFTIFV